jgi:UDP-glucose 4-epimerase
VHGVARRNSSYLADAVRQWTCDVADFDALSSVWSQVRPDLVFHLASMVTGSRDTAAVLPALRANLVGAVNCYSIALEAGCRRVITAGSMEEPIAHADEVAGSPYAAAKAAASEYARMFHALYALPVVGLRIYMVYGPRQRDLSKLVPYVTTSLLRGESPKLSSGSRQVDWIYVSDVVDAFVAAATMPGVEGKSVDVGSGRAVSIRQVVEFIVQSTGSRVSPEFGALEDRPLERLRLADTEATASILGWTPKVAIDDGIARTVDWYRAALSRGDLGPP